MSQQGFQPAGGMGMDAANAAQQEEAKRKAEQQNRDRRNVVLSQCLDQDARARLNTLAIAKPEKAAQVEDMIIRMRQSGQMFGKYRLSADVITKNFNSLRDTVSLYFTDNS